MAQTPTPACSAQETLTLAAVTQGTSACLLTEMRLMCSEQSAFHVDVRRRLSAQALETGTPQPPASVDSDQEVEDTLEEEGMGQVRGRGHGVSRTWICS